MARGDLAIRNLIEVAAAPPRKWRPEQLDGSGIFPSLTGQLFVSFKSDVRPSFDLGTGFRTAIAREAGYWLVARLEEISQALPERIAKKRPQRACRALQRAFARRFVLPKPHISKELTSQNLGNRDMHDGRLTDHRFRFEATRRVFTFQDEHAEEHRLICHVLSEREHRTTDRLLIDFVRAIREGQEPEEIRCDAGSGLCLWSQPSGHLAGKIYREVVIAPLEAMPKAQSQRVDTGYRTGQAVIDEPYLDTVKPLHEIQAEDSRSGTTGEIYDGFDERLYRRSEIDWELVAGKIAKAQEEARPLDDDFIEGVAHLRQELAGSYSYADHPDAGPTLESSRRIVRSIVKLHLSALEQYEADEDS